MYSESKILLNLKNMKKNLIMTDSKFMRSLLLGHIFKNNEELVYQYNITVTRPKRKHIGTVETQYNEILGTEKFVCYIRYFVISVVNKQYKTKEIHWDRRN